MLEQELERNRRIQEEVMNGADPAALDQLDLPAGG